MVLFGHRKMSRKKIFTFSLYNIIILYTCVLSIKHVRMVGYRPSFVCLFIEAKARPIKLQMKINEEQG